MREPIIVKVPLEFEVPVIEMLSDPARHQLFFAKIRKNIGTDKTLEQFRARIRKDVSEAMAKRDAAELELGCKIEKLINLNEQLALVDAMLAGRVDFEPEDIGLNQEGSGSVEKEAHDREA